MTDLNKPVKRRSHELRRDRSRMRRIVVSLHPAGYIGLRLEKTRREELLPIIAAYDMAVKMRVAHEKVQRDAARKARRG